MASYLSYDLGRLSIVDCAEILLHGSVVVLLLVQIVSVLSVYYVLLRDICSEFLSEIYCQDI
jgi:hypothetical protein